MDPSSSYAMARLVGMTGQFDIAFADDPGANRHGVVAGPGGLMNPNHYLASAVHALFSSRPGWGGHCAVNKTMVTSSMIDRVAARLGRGLVDVPVGFK